MVEAVLVRAQIEDGERIVRQLDDDRFPVDSALWYYEREREAWLLLISTRLVSEIGPKESYERIKRSLDKLHGQFESEKLAISLIKPNHKILEILRSKKTFGNIEGGISRIQIGSTASNGTPIEGALLYRLSARAITNDR